MYQVTAAEFIPLPTIDTMLAVKMNLSPRDCRIFRIAASFPAD
jgi:hypothetical protein